MNNISKKFLCVFLAILMLVLCLSACEGEYHGIQNNKPEGSDAETGGDTPVDDTDPFTVKLVLEEEHFTKTAGIQVQWSDGSSVHRASFDSDGIARISGLDGDYKVTLHGLDEKYTYDANVYVATNKNKNITVEIYEHISTRGSGSGLYGSDVIKITRVGAYTANVKANSKGIPQTVYYEFSPSRAGTYVIDTIADITANEINPSLDIYYGHSQYKNYSHTVDSGASESEYTRNARYVIEVDAQNVGGAYTFGVTATHKDGLYPIPVTFLVRFMGAYQNPDYYRDFTVIIPDQKGLADRGVIDESFISGELHYPEVKVTNSVYVFDGDMFAINPDDGYYHVVDENGAPTGPILFAKISRRHRFFADYQGSEVAFDSNSYYGVICVEDPGNKALQVLGENSDENYKLFIQGSDACSEVVGMESYTGYLGYGDYVDNSEGVYPVTAELEEFLQKFSVAQRYFNDGNGWAETTAEDELGYRIYSSEQDQWLFACCYYS